MLESDNSFPQVLMDRPFGRMHLVDTNSIETSAGKLSKHSAGIGQINQSPLMNHKCTNVATKLHFPGLINGRMSCSIDRRSASKWH